MSELTPQDLKVLLDALDAWVDKDAAGEMLGSLVGALLSDKRNPESMSDYKMEQEQARSEAKGKKELRKRQATLIAAKLIQMQEAAAVTVDGSPS